MIRRYKSSELGESAGRRVGYDFTCEYAKSGRATCRGCSTQIGQGELRLALMLQDEEGYKSTSWTHFDCFWKHKETKKMRDLSELHNFSSLKQPDRERVAQAWEALQGGPGGAPPAKKRTAKKTEASTPPSASSSSSSPTKKRATRGKKKSNSDDDEEEAEAEEQDDGSTSKKKKKTTDAKGKGRAPRKR
eukprot:TRINITY_DN1335_c0_g1_i1.p1 TRINITY_DN1335_c0_g1~~TRINITY_DN1335_c0_g1_i1.p1  ORF type:complete len:200 (-),score=50.74 TRINITY_DN1335_c0_g1_i1:457-1026(-)